MRMFVRMAHMCFLCSNRRVGRVFEAHRCFSRWWASKTRPTDVFQGGGPRRLGPPMFFKVVGLEDSAHRCFSRWWASKTRPTDVFQGGGPRRLGPPYDFIPRLQYLK